MLSSIQGFAGLLCSHGKQAMDGVSQPTQIDQNGRTISSPRNRVKQLGEEILKRSLPERLISEIRAYRKNPPDERAIDLGLRM